MNDVTILNTIKLIEIGCNKKYKHNHHKHKQMIRVLQTTVDYAAVIKHYNSIKDKTDAPLQKLDRAEGGFKLDIPPKDLDQGQQYHDDTNDKIKQLRWKNKCLVVQPGMQGFNANELWYLFSALKMSMGDENVEWVG